MSYATVGDYLYGAQGYRWTGHMSSVPVALVPTVGTFNPAKPWNGVDTGDMFYSRYGCLNMGWKDGATAAWQDSFKARYSQAAFSNGTLAPSHLTAPGILPDLLKLCRRMDNPLQLAGNAAYVPTLQDAQDCLMLVKPQGNGAFITAWQAVMEPLLASEKPAQGPPAPPGGPIVQPPVVTTPPTPIVPPAAAQGLPPLTPSAGRIVELEAIAAKVLYQELSAPWDALPWLTMLVALRPLTVRLLQAWRRSRRFLGDPRAIPPEDL